jgi:hypothetical protein
MKIFEKVLLLCGIIIVCNMFVAAIILSALTLTLFVYTIISTIIVVPATYWLEKAITHKTL